MKGTWLCLALATAAWGQPELKKVIPDRARSGSLVSLTGCGFGSSQADVKVLFGKVPASVVSVTDDTLKVTVPWEAETKTTITVASGQATSNPLPFQCLPTLRLTIDKNPIDVGERTTAHFQLYHSQEAFTIWLTNTTPEVVRYVGGDKQSLRTCGGAINTADFIVEGIQGNRLFQADYRWGKRGQEEVEWTLPFHKVPWTGKP